MSQLNASVSSVSSRDLGEIEEGPLGETTASQSKDASSIVVHGEEQPGLPDRFLLPSESTFHTLPTEMTANLEEDGDSTVPSTVVGASAAQMSHPLRVEDTSQELKGAQTAGGIVFSPGGSQAFVVPDAATQPAYQNRRHHPHRRTDVEQATSMDETKRVPVAWPSDSNKVESLKSRLMDLKSTLDRSQDLPGASSVESSPRMSQVGCLQAGNDPEGGFHLSEKELVTTDAESLPSPRTRSGALTDRATSPSVASVISIASSTASGMTTGRRNLEWDSGADLGYLGDAQPQKDAAASLSTLEKIAIGNYASYLTEPEGKSLGKGAGSSSSFSRPSRQDRQNAEDEMRQHRLHKFADSLLRRREMRPVVSDASANSDPARGRRRTKNSKKATPDSSPSRSCAIERSPIKSASLTDLQGQAKEDFTLGNHRTYRSSSDVTQYASNTLRFQYGSEEPSSCSSTGTVVPTIPLDDPPVTGRLIDLQGINTDPNSLPMHLHGMLFQGGPAYDAGGQPVSTSSSSTQPPTEVCQPPLQQSQPSQSCLHSRQSASRSFETVINVNVSKRPQKNRWVTKDNLHSDSVDTEEGEGKDEGSDEVPGAVGGVSLSNGPGQQKSKRKMPSNPSGPSSVPTTSDEESKYNDRCQRVGSRHRGSFNRERLPSTNTATSTMESAHRAKSFEYIPGEHFPIQDYASSYEYLPGHLITDRPGTVVSNYQNEVGNEFNLSGFASFAESDVSELSARDERRPSASHGGARRRINLPSDQQDPTDCSKILDEHMRKTKYFYKKMRKYIAYVATNSETAADSRKKQEVLDQLLVLMKKQESKLEADTRRASSGGSQRTAAKEPTGLQQSKLAETDCDESEPETRKIDAPAAAGVSVDNDRSLNTAKSTPACDEASSASPTTTIDSATVPSSSAGPRSSGGDMKKNKERVATPSKKRQTDAADSSAIQLHQQRIEQMRVLRKEIKKLERLEYAHLGQALQNAGGGLTFLAGPSDLSDDSSLISTSTYMSEQLANLHQQLQKLPSSPAAKRVDKVASKGAKRISTAFIPAGVKGKCESGLDSKTNVANKAISHSQMSIGSLRTFTRSTVSKSKVIEGKTQHRGDLNRGLGGRPTSRTEEASASSSGGKKNKTRRATNSDFGQTYPTPRDAFEAAVETKGVQTTNQEASTTDKPIHRTKKLAKKRNKKPVAYYLHVPADNPIRAGAKILRDRRHNVEEGIEKENRSLLANYMAGLDTAAIDLDRKTRSKHPQDCSSSSDNGQESQSTSARPPATLTLQDALVAKRPDFMANANRRVFLLKRARQQRLEHEERVRNWMDQVAKLPASKRPIARPNFSPLRVQRVFNYREMVESTRRKYEQLPEVRNRVSQRKKKSSYNTNRMMRDFYKLRLQEQVLRGRVSMNHFRNVV